MLTLSSLLLLPLLFQSTLSDDNVLVIATGVYGRDARLIENISIQSIVTPFSVSNPVKQTEYCIGVQEYFPLQIQTPFGPSAPPMGGKPRPEITKKGCGASWIEALEAVLRSTVTR